MCGICGIIAFNDKRKISINEVIEMRDTMHHRGPDDSGVYIKDKIGLGHRRLSIIDLSINGRQPMSNTDDTVYIVFNGEFYNYKDYIQDLKNKGYRFKSSSDTEVLLHLYEEYGLDETLKRIIGMYAFCLVDYKRNVQYLVRDRFGIKPLYYTLNENRIAFASELKAFYKMVDFEPRINQDLIPEFFLYFRTINFTTLLEDTYEVKPGTYLEIKNDIIKEKKYYQIPINEEYADITENEALDEFDKLITKSIEYRLVSDVPVGVFLSGGIDSSIIAIKMAEIMDRPVNTISAGYKEAEANEFEWSDKIAQMIKSNHKKFYDNADDFFSLLPWLTYIFDAPLNTGVSFYKAAKFAKENCTVMLCGQGSDEIFGGYERYKYSHWQNQINKIVSPFTKNKFSNNVLERISTLSYSKIFTKTINRLNLNGHKIAAAYAAGIPEQDFKNSLKVSGKKYSELLDQFAKLWPHDSQREFLHNMLYAEMYNGLQAIIQQTDKMTMAASVETRVPFLDHNLVEFAFKLPRKYKVRNNQGKYLLKKYLLRYVDEDFVYRQKKGFPVPIYSWFKNNQFNFNMEDSLPDLNIFNKKYLQDYSIIAQKGKLGVKNDAIGPLIRYYALSNWLLSTKQEYNYQMVYDKLSFSGSRILS